MRHTASLILVFWGAALLGGCASAPRVETVKSPDADFDAYSTFTFRQPLGTDRNDGTRTIVSQKLEQTARMQLEGKGYRYIENDADEDKADLRVNFFMETREVVEGGPSTGVSVGYGSWYRSVGVWSEFPGRARQVTEGTLHVDVADVERDQLVWEGMARERLSDDDLSFDVERLRRSVQRILADFPIRGRAD